MCQNLLIIIGTIHFGFLISTLVILAPKKQKKHISRFKFWSCRQQKCYRNPVLGHFVPPKEYGRHYHRYLGKFKFFGSIGSQKVAKKNCPPAICRVKKMWKNIVILVDIEVVCTINLPNSSIIQNAPTIRLMNHRLEIKKDFKVEVGSWFSYSCLNLVVSKQMCDTMGKPQKTFWKYILYTNKKSFSLIWALIEPLICFS